MIQRSKITPPELARRWGIKPDKVLAWIRMGDLAAINAATHPGGRPRYLIGLDDVAAFESLRSVSPQPRKDQHRCKRKNANSYVKEFF